MHCFEWKFFMTEFIKSFEVKENYLLVVAHGTRNSFLDVVKGTTEFAQIIKDTNCTKVLLDYRQVTFKVNLSDAYNTVKFYEQLGALSRVTMAALINAETVALAKTWKEVSVQRGFSMNYFLDKEEAVHWLTSK